MNYELKSCSADNNVWNHVKSCWREECDAYGEEFDYYARASMSVLDELAISPSKNAKVYVLYRVPETGSGPEAESDSESDTASQQKEIPVAIFQANVTPLPGFDGKVLRIRHMVMSPDYDYGDVNADDYKKILVETFAHATALGYGELKANHVKFHFRTPSDLYFFREMRPSLEKEEEIHDVKAYGAWISFSFSSADAEQ